MYTSLRAQIKDVSGRIFRRVERESETQRGMEAVGENNSNSP